MTKQEELEIMLAVPVGEANAKPSREVWRIAKLWAETTFSQMLQAMAKDGRVSRRQEPTPTGFKWVYWRSADRIAA
jgi:hypothetical protein